MDTRPGKAKEDLQQAGGVLVKDGGIGREKASEEVSWNKSGIAERLVKSNRQTYYTVKKDSPLTFNVNEGTYMDRFKQNDQKGISRKAQIKKQVGITCILGEIEVTLTLGGTECRAGLWGVQNWVKEGGLGGPRNTTLQKKNG